MGGEHMSIALSNALVEAAHGCPIFPVRAPVFTDDGTICSCDKAGNCLVPGKHPHIKGWPGLATSDRAQIDRWASAFSGCNWGGTTGKTAGRIIIEVDPRAGGDEGLEALERELGPLPETRTYRSGSGGVHYIFAYPAELDYVINTAGNVGPHEALGVDVRGDGGYGVLPGSLHKSGNRYELVEDLPLAELPAAWRDALAAETPTEAGPNAEPYDGPRAVIAPIMANCAFMAHARDDAATLGEDDWWMALTIAACTEDGIANAHRLSEAYPTYSHDETEAKAQRARQQDKPFSCAGIAKRTNGRFCEGCKHRDKIKGPIVLGIPRPKVSWPSGGASDGDDAHDAETGDESAEKTSRKKPSQATMLVELAIERGTELFHDPNGVPFARLKVGEHWEVWPISSKGFKTQLQAAFYAQHRAAAGAQGVADAIATLEGIALFEGPERPVSIRTALGEDGATYIDLGDADWRAVRVSGTGWEVIADSPVMFQRTTTSRALPYPEVGGCITDLTRFVNTHDGAKGDDFLLLTGMAIAALRPVGPYPILDLAGEQGAGKSTVARVLCRLVDPRSVELANFPRDDGDLATVAGKRQLLIFDNVSYISDDNSDKLCRLSTGGGFHKRKLYTDDEEHAVDAMKPTILTGIPDLSTRSDLADRTTTIEVPSLRGVKRIPETVFWSNFEAAAPKLFGALLDLLVVALRNLPSIQRDDLPRMADFARLGEAMLPALHRPDGDFIRAMRENADRQNDIIIEAYPEAAALLWWSKSWTDNERNTNAAALLNTLGDQVSAETKKSKSWPKTTKDLSTNLRRLKPNLLAAGLSVEFIRTAKERSIRLERRTPETNKGDASFASHASSDQEPPGSHDANDANSEAFGPENDEPSTQQVWISQFPDLDRPDREWKCKECGQTNPDSESACFRCGEDRRAA